MGTYPKVLSRADMDFASCSVPGRHQAGSSGPHIWTIWGGGHGELPENWPGTLAVIDSEDG
jgi:hypothetical protein